MELQLLLQRRDLLLPLLQGRHLLHVAAAIEICGVCTPVVSSWCCGCRCGCCCCSAAAVCLWALLLSAEAASVYRDSSSSNRSSTSSTRKEPSSCLYSCC